MCVCVCVLVCGLLPAATKMGQGNVFTGVCDSVNRGGSASGPRGCTPPGETPPSGQIPPGRHTHWANIPCPVHAGIHIPPPLWTEFLTDGCENIIFKQLLLRTVIIVCRRKTYILCLRLFMALENNWPLKIIFG